MNKLNVKYWQDGDRLYGEWADRALDDEDRDNEDTVKIATYVEVAGMTPEAARLKCESILLGMYDAWVAETR